MYCYSLSVIQLPVYCSTWYVIQLPVHCSTWYVIQLPVYCSTWYVIQLPLYCSTWYVIQLPVYCSTWYVIQNTNKATTRTWYVGETSRNHSISFAGLLAMHPEGPVTGHLDTSPFGFPLSLRKYWDGPQDINGYCVLVKHLSRPKLIKIMFTCCLSY
jgi:hypothetical protein